MSKVFSFWNLGTTHGTKEFRPQSLHYLQMSDIIVREKLNAQMTGGKPKKLKNY